MLGHLHGLWWEQRAMAGECVTGKVTHWARKQDETRAGYYNPFWCHVPNNLGPHISSHLFYFYTIVHFCHPWGLSLYMDLWETLIQTTATIQQCQGVAEGGLFRPEGQCGQVDTTVNCTGLASLFVLLPLGEMLQRKQHSRSHLSDGDWPLPGMRPICT